MGRRVSVQLDEQSLEVNVGDGLHDHVNVLDATELCAYKGSQ